MLPLQSPHHVTRVTARPSASASSAAATAAAASFPSSVAGAAASSQPSAGSACGALLLSSESSGSSSEEDGCAALTAAASSSQASAAAASALMGRSRHRARRRPLPRWLLIVASLLTGALLTLAGVRLLSAVGPLPAPPPAWPSLSAPAAALAQPAPALQLDDEELLPPPAAEGEGLLDGPGEERAGGCDGGFALAGLVDRSVNVTAAWEQLIARYLSPWLREKPLFAVQDALSPQWLTSYHSLHREPNFIARFRITRWKHNAEGRWELQPGRARLFWVGLPCVNGSTATRRQHPIHDSRIRAWWWLLQYLIDATPQDDFPDYLDLLLWLHDAPQARLVSFASEGTPPILSNCGSPQHVNVPFVFQHQLINKPVEPLCQRAIDHVCSTCPQDAPLPCSQRHRPVEQAVWRGSTTGARYRPSNWQSAKRSQLVLLSKEEQAATVDARFTRCSMCVNGTEAVMREALGAWFGASGFSFEDYLSMTALIDVDGNAWSSRFYELLATGTPVLKVFGPVRYEEFFYPLLEPGRHYVEIDTELSALKQEVLRLRSNGSEAQRIGHEAMRFVATYLRVDSWRSYAVTMLRALSAITVKPFTKLGARYFARARMANLEGKVCPFVSGSWCACTPHTLH